MTSELYYTRAYSVKLDPWYSLGPISNRLFEQDFCAQNVLNLKILSNSLGGSKIRFKQLFNFSNKQLEISDDIRICIPIRDDSTFYARLRNNVMKLQYDHGIEVWRGLIFDLYGSLNFTKYNTSSTNLQVGAIILGREYFFDNLFKLSNNYVRWYHKTMIKMDRFRFGLVGVMDFTTSNFLKKDLLFGYCHPKVQVYALATQAWNQHRYEPDIFSKYKMSLIYKDNSQRNIGIQIDISKDLKSIEQVTALVQHRFGGRNRMKVKANNKLNFDFLWQMQLNEHIVTSLGFKTGLAKQNHHFLFGSKIQINI